MKSHKFWVALLVLILIALLVPRYLGGKVASEVEAYSQLLVAHDDVRVKTFVYHPGWFQGTLEYDLTVQITQPDLQAAFAEFDPDFDNSLQLKGSLPIQHGPWVGGPIGFALAATEWTLPLPEALREALPQYPGQAPVLSLSAALTLSGQLRADLQTIGYQGKIVAEDLEQAINLVLAPSHLIVNAAPNGEQFDVVFELPKLSFDVVDAGERTDFSLESLRLRGAYHLLQPFVWIGSGKLEIAEMRVQDNTGKTHVDNLEWLGETQHQDGQIANTLAFTTGAITFESEGQKVSVEDTEFAVSLRSLPLAPYAELMRVYHHYVENNFALDLTADDQTKLEQALQTLLAAQPVLAIDRLGFRMTDAGGFNAHFSLKFAGSERLDWNDTEALMRAVEIDAKAHLDNSALKAMMTLLNTDDSITADSAYFAMLSEWSNVPWLKIDDQQIASSLRFSDGALTINEQPFEDFLPLLGLAWAGLSSVFADDALHDEYAHITPPDFYHELETVSEEIAVWEEPLFGRYALETGYENDPFLVEIAAGGNANLHSEVAETCWGWVNASGPDVVVEFTAGPYPFSMYAVAPDGTDTTLAVVDPSGYWYCNDDHENLGLNPGIEFEEPLSGEYRVWVGTHDASTIYTELYFTEQSLD